MRLVELADKRGNIYFYFAGHGVPDKDGNSYILPFDMSADSIYVEPNLELSSIYKSISSAKAKDIFIFMDSCFSGKDDKGELLYQGVAPVLRTSKAKNVGSNMTIFTAGGSNDFANDYEQKQQRLFSYYLIDELSKGEKNTKKIYENIKDKVKKSSLLKGLGYKQVPKLYGNEKNDIY